MLDAIFREFYATARLPEEIASVELLGSSATRTVIMARPTRPQCHYGFAELEEGALGEMLTNERAFLEALERAIELAVGVCYMASSWA